MRCSVSLSPRTSDITPVTAAKVALNIESVDWKQFIRKVFQDMCSF
ncbi:hypothetical protein AOR13_928 [Alteromonas stellipolaris LMG 21856]|nr:hypothetical protein AOR13_928 [Alteromonas stellipolaris LMG 21856]